MSLIRRSLERRGADPTLPWGSSRIPTNGELGGSTPSGQNINEDSAMRLFPVFTSVAILADSVSTLPIDTFKKTGDRSKIPVDPAPIITTDPWPEGSLQDWLTMLMYSLTLRGNAYGEIVDRDTMGFATTIMPIHPDRVMPRRNPSTGLREYRVDGRLIPLEDVFHIPALLAPGQFVGLNPIEFMRNNWGMAAASEAYGGAFFRNSANPSGVITVQDELDDDQVLAMAQSWKAAHQGVGAAQLPAVLGGGATWQQISVNPDDAQFIMSRQLSASDIFGFFRIPPHMVGQQDKTTSWGTGVEIAELSYVTNTLSSWITRLETGIQRLRPPTEVIRFNLANRLRADTLARYQAYTLGRNGGWLSTNDIRKLENQTDIGPEGDVYWGPMNYAPLDKMIDGTFPPAPGGTVPNGQGVGGGIADNPNAPQPGVDTGATQP